MKTETFGQWHRWHHDMSPSAQSVSVRCIECGRWRKLSEVYADLNGAAFKDYYCTEHLPGVTPDSAINPDGRPAPRLYR